MRLDSLLLSLSTFFATIGPADLVLVFAALTERMTTRERRLMALRGTLIATGILLFFAVFGEPLLKLFGITIPALRIAGGVLLLLISIDMVFARHSGGTGTTPEEESEAKKRVDISVFPLATPLIAGPGAISAVILLATAEGAFSVGWFIVNNIVLPRVMSQAVGIHPVVVLITVLIGIKIAGIAGAIFALPFAAVVAAFFQSFLSRNAGEPRDVTTRAAKRVGEREGRRVRVPKEPAATPTGTSPAAAESAPGQPETTA